VLYKFATTKWWYAVVVNSTPQCLRWNAVKFI